MPSPAHHPRLPCGPGADATVARSPASRVYVHLETRNGVERPVLRACTRGARRSSHLGWANQCGGSSGCSGVGPVVLSGRFVAFADSACCGIASDAYGELHVIDLRSGARRPALGYSAVGADAATLTGLVLRGSGSVAYALQHRSPPGSAASAVTEIRRSPGCGRVVLDSGADVDARSLRRTGSRVTWMRAGSRRSARLC